MTPQLRTIVLLMCWLLVPFYSSGTHIAGGEVTYKYISSDKYLVRLTLFVDCFNGSVNAILQDSTAVIAYFDAKNYGLKNYDEIWRSSPTRVEELHYNCVKFTTDACVDQYIYEYEKTIDPGENGVIIAFQRCCRNGTITNLINPQDVGATYWAYIPPDTLITQNSSPYFRKLPPNFLCTNAPLIFDHSAIDPDGDSLVYSLVAPFDGADRFVPRPVPPANPPFTNVVYASPYSVAQMMGAKSGLSIDRTTGELRVTPQTTGQFVVGIKVSEYRNGMLISEVLRDYQFNVYNCVFETQANFINPDRVCKDTVYFTDKSSQAAFYHWDFGIDSIGHDTSNAVNPYWLYPDDGKYKVTLIVGNKDCKDTFYNFVTIVHADSIHAVIGPGLTEGCGVLDLCLSNQGDKTPDWFWNWGDGSDEIHNGDTVCHLYTVPGLYYPTLTIVDSSKCNISDAISLPVNIYPVPTADFEIDSIGCAGFVRTRETSSGYTSREWYFSGLDTTVYDNPNPEVEFDSSGNFNIEFRVSNDHCSDTLKGGVVIDLDNFVSADIAPVVDPNCVPVYVHFNIPPGKRGYNKWDFGDGTILMDTMIARHLYTKPGTYTLKFDVTDPNSCNEFDQAEFTFKVYGPTSPDFTLAAEPCQGNIHLDNYTEGGMEFTWDLGDGSYSDAYSPDHFYKRKGTYTITLNVDTAGPCPSAVSKEIYIDGIGLDELFIPNIFTPNQDHVNDCFSISGVANACYDYTFIVYNRWGETVYESEDIAGCWDGRTTSGAPLPEGTYFSIYTLTEKASRTEHKFSGTITLIR